MKVILTTGGAGFVGSYFIKYFLRRNKNFIIVNIDKLTQPSGFDNLKDVEDSPRHHFVKGDICNQDLVNYIMKRYRPDYIINFASENSTDRSVQHPLLYSQTNLTGTVTLLEAARYVWGKNNFLGNRFIQISTDEVYGESPLGEFLSEESELKPYTPYAASKAASDLIVSSYFKTFGFPAIITRCCNNYGPYQGTANFIPRSIINAITEKSVEVDGDGNTLREWIHVQDHCIGIIRSLFYGKPGEIYNIGSGEQISDIEIALKLLSLLKKPEELLQKVPDRVISNSCSLNSYKARNNLSWSAKYKFEEGLSNTVMWYKNNQDWWKDKN